MNFRQYERDLKDPKYNDDYILNRYFHSGKSHVFLEIDPAYETAFKSELIDSIFNAIDFRCHPLELVICGSAHLGFSPVPSKLGNPFDARKSDIDVAVVSQELFEMWWSELQSLSLTDKKRSQIADNLFWGLIDPFTVLEVSDIAQRWWDALGKLRPLQAFSVRGRVYKNHWSMQEYHRRAIIQARNDLTGRRV